MIVRSKFNVSSYILFSFGALLLQHYSLAICLADEASIKRVAHSQLLAAEQLVAQNTLSVEELKKKDKELATAEQELLELVKFSKSTSKLESGISEQDTVEQSMQASKSDSSNDAYFKEAELLEKAALEIESLKKENAKLRSELKLTSEQAQDYKSTKKVKTTKLKTSYRRMKELIQELTETKNKLLVAETQVERLSNIIMAQKQKGSVRSASSNASGKATPGELAKLSMKALTNSGSSAAGGDSDMPIATVVVDKANLRTGAGLSHSPIMSVKKGTRLVVETRQGDWYRVIAPSGKRAWVSAEIVAFGGDTHASPSGTVKVRGYNSKLEDEAFKLIRNRNRK